MGMGGIAPEWFAKEGVAIGRVIDKHRWRRFEESMASCGSWHLYGSRNCTNYPAELMSVVCRVQCTRTVAGFDYDSCCRKRCNEPISIQETVAVGSHARRHLGYQDTLACDLTE